MFSLFNRKVYKPREISLDNWTKTCLMALSDKYDERLATCDWNEIEIIKEKVKALRTAADYF